MQNIFPKGRSGHCGSCEKLALRLKEALIRFLVLLDSPYRHSLIAQPCEDARQRQPGTEIDAGFLDEGHIVVLLRFGSFAGDADLERTEVAQADNLAVLQGIADDIFQSEKYRLDICLAGTNDVLASKMVTPGTGSVYVRLSGRGLVAYDLYVNGTYLETTNSIEFTEVE